MKNISVFFTILCFAFSTSVIAQQREGGEVTASNVPIRKSTTVQNDTILDPSILRNGEIMGLENSDRRIKPEGTKEKKRADKLYRDLGFDASSRAYQSLSPRERRSEKVLARIANSHRLNHETENAEFWYAKFVRNTKTAKHLLHYAQVLQSNGKCEDAIRWFKAYKKVASRKDLKNRAFIVNCDESAIPFYPEVTINNVKELNTRHLDFSPIPYENGVVFTSTRGRDKWVDEKDKWTNDNFTDLFYSEMDKDGNFSKPAPFLGEVNGRFHDGTASFNQGNSVMVFTRNNTAGKSRDGMIDLKVYSANKSDEYWADIEELPFNSNNYSTCHPTLSADGRRVYFSSNRPDGYGGMDIYVSEDQGGMWSKPLNLGPTVNSSGNEIFPFVGEDENLYYSSNGHAGIGGLDIYKATKANERDETSWIHRENMGKPFNSKKDDFGFYINKEQNMGYLSSSRRGGSGKDDIYAWKTSNNEVAVADEMATVTRQICVYEEGTDDRIGKAHVTMTARNGGGSYGSEENNEMILTLKPVDEDKNEYVLGLSQTKKETIEKVQKDFRTNGEGNFKYEKVKRNQIYDIRVEKYGFLPVNMAVSAEELWEVEEYCIPMKKQSCAVLDGLVTNKKYKMPMPGAKVKMLDKCTLEETVITTEEDGAFEFCVRCGCEYRLSASKSGFDDDYEFVSTLEMDCNGGEPVEALLELSARSIQAVTSAPEPISNPAPANPSYTYPTQPSYTPPAQQVMVPVVTYETVVTYQPVTSVQPVTTYVPASQLNGMHLNRHLNGDPNARIHEGQLITLDDVYYDFDKFNIRSDASIDLEHVLQLMQRYPSMTISMESHTDARGTNIYNNTLSQNRAESARKYLISRGIAAQRIMAQGFGESRLRNRCADGTVCTEQEHQWNRRTEIRILTFDEAGVGVGGRR